MTPSDWMTISLVCLAGAASPGMSLAMIIKNTVAGGTFAGILASWVHALGIMCYALMTVFGMSLLFQRFPWLFSVLLIFGALYLFRIGLLSFKDFITASKAKITETTDQQVVNNASYSLKTAVVDGMSISLLNPKVLLFFGAIFSGFIHQQTLSEKISMGLLAFLTDGLWYSFIAILFGIPRIRERFVKNQRWLSLIFGFVFLGYAVYLALSAFGL